MSELFLRDLVPIIELQAVELKRLLRDKHRLSRKVESLIEEIGRLRETQQQGLVLREKDQALRMQMQDTVNALLMERRGSETSTDARHVAGQIERGPPRDVAAAKTTLVKTSDGAEQIFPADGEGIGIPSFLIAGDAATAAGIEPPIRKLFTRIRARSDAG